MKTLIALTLIGVPAVAAADPVPTPAIPGAPLAAPHLEIKSSTKDPVSGKTTVTITIEKDGQRETRTLHVDKDTPFNVVADALTESLEGGGTAKPDRPAPRKVTYLGVQLADPVGGTFFGDGMAESDGSAPLAGLPVGTGLTVTGVNPGSPAEKAGLQAGDVLARLNDQILVNPAQFTTLIRAMKEGEAVTLSLVRQGESKQVEATLGSLDVLDPTPPGFPGLAGFSTPGPGDVSGFGRIFTLDPNGNVIETPAGALSPPPPAGAPPAPPVPPAPPAPPSGISPDLRPAWESTLREAAAAKEKAAAQWQEQLSKWRTDWAEHQKVAAEEYRKAMDKMGEELAKAREAAEKARQEARRAIEDVLGKLEEHKNKPSQPAPETETPESETPKSE